MIITNNLQNILDINHKLYEEEKELLINRLNENSKNYEVEKKKIIDRIDSRKNIPHKSYLIWLFKNEIIDEKEFTFMNIVRNTFSHNQFPQKSTMELFITKWNNNKFACQILEIYKQKTDNIIKKLKDM